MYPQNAQPVANLEDATDEQLQQIAATYRVENAASISREALIDAIKVNAGYAPQASASQPETGADPTAAAAGEEDTAEATAIQTEPSPSGQPPASPAVDSHEVGSGSPHEAVEALLEPGEKIGSERVDENGVSFFATSAGRKIAVKDGTASVLVGPPIEEA